MFKKYQFFTFNFIFLLQLLQSCQFALGVKIKENISNNSNLSLSLSIIDQSTTLNRYLNGNQTGKFTFFVPNNEAWTKLTEDWPETLGKIFHEEYYGTRLLERHLVWSNVAYDTKLLSTDKGQKKLSTVRDTLEIAFLGATTANDSNETNYAMEWKHERGKSLIKLVRVDVACDDGILHIIDTPLLKSGDIIISSKSTNLNIETMNLFIMLLFYNIVCYALQ